MCDIQPVYNNNLTIQAMSTVLERVTLCNEKNLRKLYKSVDHKNKRVIDYYPQFNTVGVSKLCFYDYMLRINEYICCSKEAFIIAMIYLNRFQGVGNKNNHKSIILTRKNIHKSYLTALVLAIKYHDDDHCTNDYYSKIAGMSLKKLNHLESTMLTALQYDLNFTQTEYNQFYNTVEMKYEVIYSKQNKKTSDTSNKKNVSQNNNETNKEPNDCDDNEKRNQKHSINNEISKDRDVKSGNLTPKRLISSKSSPDLRQRSSLFHRILVSVAA